MKIRYLGDFSQPWHTETHVARDLEALGYTVERATDLADGADLVLLQGNGGLTGDHRARFRELEAAGCVTAAYHLDLFVGLARATRVTVEPMWQVQTVFTPDGDPESAKFFAAVGIDHRWLPAAVVSDETEPGSWRSEYDYDVVFVGSGSYHPEWPWRQQLIRWLHRTYGSRFRHFDHHPPTRGRDLNDLYATARVVVGDSLALPGHTDYTSDRIFETLGRGGTLVYPKVPGLDRLGFREPDHLRFYEVGDFEELERTIDTLLAQPEDARLMAKRGQQFVADHHTYRHRAQHMLLELDLA